MNIDNRIIADIKSDIKELIDGSRLAKRNIQSARATLAHIYAQMEVLRLASKAIPKPLQKEFEKTNAKISVDADRLETLGRKINMLQTAVAFANGRLHPSPHLVDKLELVKRAKITFSEVYSWYEFWHDNNDCEQDELKGS